jgi:8-hydroxy-5-deazaflavin:NADPH oxidoreductase
MKIAVIGAGMIGATAARLFTQADHEVVVSNSRGPASLAPLVAELGPRARAMTVADAARWGEVVLLAVPWRTPDALPPPDTVAGKIVIDAMNPYGPSGSIIDLGGFTSSEEVAKRLPGARLVKAFNTIYYEHLARQGRPDAPLEQRRAIFIAGDDVAAKKVVSGLIQEIGFAPVDTGTLREGGRSQEPGGPLSNRNLTYAEAVTILAAAS